MVLLVPDQSLEWIGLLKSAVGVVMVGGGLLSHLALQLLRLQIPTVFGLTPKETASLSGRQVVIKATKNGSIRVIPDEPAS